MREIKFRAWVKYTTDHRWDWAYKKAEEKMASNQDLDDDGERLRREFEEEWDKSHKPEEQISVKEYMANLDEVKISLCGQVTRLINIDVLNIMQFTGLNDRTGKAIYEGDILAINNISNIKYEVRFGNYEPYGSNERQQGFYLYDDSDSSTIPLTENYKILGNIYENPELLGERQGE